jgi:hypothetical protein
MQLYTQFTQFTRKKKNLVVLYSVISIKFGTRSTTFWLEYPKEVSSSKSLLRERGAYLQYHLCKLKIAMGLH